MKNSIKYRLIIIVIVIFILLLVYFSFSKQEDIIIGVAIPLTGYGATLGEDLKKGFELAKEDLNITNIHFVYEDSKGNAAEAANIANKFITVNDIKIIFSSFSGASISISEITKDYNVLHLYSAGTIEPIKNGSIKIAYYDYYRECVNIANYLKKNNIQNINYIYANGDFSVNCENGLRDGYADLNIIIYKYEYSKEDFSTILLKAKQNNYSILFTGYEDDFLLIYKKYSELGMNNLLFCIAGEECFSEKLEEYVPENTISFGLDIGSDFKSKILDKYSNVDDFDIFAITQSYIATYCINDTLLFCNDYNIFCLKENIINCEIPKTIIDNNGISDNMIQYNTKLYIYNNNSLELLK